MDKTFVETFDDCAEKAHCTAVEQGFWPQNRNFGEALALVHSELSEALECMRCGNPLDKDIPSMLGIEVQLADVLILLMDISKGYRFDIAGAAMLKMEFNKNRKHKHGKKF